MKSKYEATIDFIRTSVNNLQSLFEEVNPYSYRMFTLIQINRDHIRGYK